MRRFRSEQSGWAVVTAITLLTVMLGVGLATMSTVDVQTKESRVERERESAFNLAEGALNAQIFELSRRWPGTSALVFSKCTPSATPTGCPTAGKLNNSFATVDGTPSNDWRISVHNNEQPNKDFYSDTTTRNQPGWDAPDASGKSDGRVWVRAQATLRGKTRTLIALVEVQNFTEDLPRAALVSGSVEFENSGNGKTFIDGNGNPTEGVPNIPTPGAIIVRCDPANPSNATCMGHSQNGNAWKKMPNIVEPWPLPSGSYNTAEPDAMEAEAVARLEQRAIADGTWFATCAAAAASATKLSGAVVYIQTCDGTRFGDDYNTAANPGIVIVERGPLHIGNGNATYNGIIYHRNLDDSCSVLFDSGGNMQVRGQVLIDGCGVASLGASSRTKVLFDDLAWKNIRSYSSAGIIQNTWREIIAAPCDTTYPC